MKIIKRILDKNFYLYSLVTFIAFYVLLPSVALTKPPTIEITEPLNGADVAGNIPIEVKASDNTGVSQVEFFIDGVFLGLDPGPPESGDIWSHDWDTDLVNDGLHFITAKATDTSGKTSTDRIGVTVDNDNDNIRPIAKIYYSWDGRKYYFYPYECYDPDGYILKYKYEIMPGTDSESDTYTCCDFCDEILCVPDECFPIDRDVHPNFDLFYVCPYVSYEFPVSGTETYTVQLTVVDNEGGESLPAEETITLSSPGSTDDMYVGKINPRIKYTGSGATLMFIVTVQYDSNSDGQSGSDDSPLPGVLVEMQLKRDSELDGEFVGGTIVFTDSGTTDRDGQVGFSARGLEHGDYKAEIIEMTDSNGKVWNRDLDRGNPRYVTIWPLGRK